MKKSSFLTFICSLLPGAGQMYLGYMQRGSSLMLLFFGAIFLFGLMRFDMLLLFLPVIWFYAFFDTWSIRSLTPEERAATPDQAVFCKNGQANTIWQNIAGKRHLAIGAGLILLGIWLLIDTFIRPLLDQISQTLPWLYNLIRNLPVLAIGAVIIILGVYLIKGKKPAAPKSPDWVDYQGGDHHGE
ncbi:MAG: hypothetical protein VB070_11730 [Clostridiaceae bacterium]|nr:hypothetical protein [Clostridiaceae bacterium]